MSIVECCRRSNNHETSDKYCKHGAAVDIKLLIRIFTSRNAFIGNGRLHKKLHIGANGSTYQSNSSNQITAARIQMRQHNLSAYRTPGWMCSEGSRNVGQEA